MESETELPGLVFTRVCGCQIGVVIMPTNVLG